MKAIALPAGELAHLALLVGPFEVEAGNVAAGSDTKPAEHEVLGSTRDLLEHGFSAVQRIAVLIDVSRQNGVADAQAAAIRLLLTDDHAKERRFAGAIGADDPDDAAARKVEVQVL